MSPKERPLTRHHVLALALLLLAAPGCSTLRSHDARIEGLSDADPEERYDNLLLLSEDAEKNPDTANELCDHALKLADAPEPVSVRLVALRALGRLAKRGVRTKEVAQKLANHARKSDEPDFWCRIEALEALAALATGPQNTQPDETVRSQVHEALLLALQMDLEPDRDVRIHAAREIALLRPEGNKVLRDLVQALSDEAPDVRYHAQRALVAIAGEDHGPTKADWDRWVRGQADRSEGPR